MAIAVTNLDSGFNASAGSSQATNSVSIAANSLVLVTFGIFVGNDTVLSLSTTTGLTFTKLIEQQDGASKTGISCWGALASGATSGTMTANLNSSPQNCSWVVDQITGGVQSSLAAAVTQAIGSLINNTNSSGISNTLSALASGSATYGGCAVVLGNHSPTTIAAGSGYTSTAAPNNSGGVNDRGQLMEYEIAGSTTVNATWTSDIGTFAVGIALEIAAPAAAGGTPYNPWPLWSPVLAQ